MGRPVTNEISFWNKVQRTPDSCWDWKGCLYLTGYGQTTRARKYYYAHRLAYEYSNGPIPAGMIICHKCDNRKCCRPSHLFLGTQFDNMRDMIEKGRDHKRGLRGEDNINSKLTSADIAQIREYFLQGLSNTQIAEKFDVTRQCIGLIKRGVNWQSMN